MTPWGKFRLQIRSSCLSTRYSPHWHLSPTHLIKSPYSRCYTPSPFTFLAPFKAHLCFMAGLFMTLQWTPSLTLSISIGPLKVFACFWANVGNSQVVNPFGNRSSNRTALKAKAPCLGRSLKTGIIAFTFSLFCLWAVGWLCANHFHMLSFQISW